MGHAEKIEQPGTTALRCFFKSFNPGIDIALTTSAVSLPADYVPCDIEEKGNLEAYVYKDPRPGLIPLRLYFNDSLIDYHVDIGDVVPEYGPGIILGYVFSRPR